jgi:hypothetical protein
MMNTNKDYKLMLLFLLKSPNFMYVGTHHMAINGLLHAAAPPPLGPAATNSGNKSSPATFIHRDLKDSTYVILWQDTTRRAFDPPYSGPHKVITHTDKLFKIVVSGRQVTVSAERVKSAYILEATQHDITTNTSSPPAQSHSAPATAVTSTTQVPRTTRSGRRGRFPARYNTQALFCTWE